MAIKFFKCTSKDNHAYFILYVIIVVHYNNSFANVKPFHIPEIKPYGVIILSVHCEIQFVNILLRDFVPTVSSYTGSQFYILVLSFLGLSIILNS